MSFLHGISWDALFGIAGLIAGSLMFAELSGWTKRTIENWGDLGKTHMEEIIMTAVRKINKVWTSEPTIEGAEVHLKRAFGNNEVPLFDPLLLLDDFRSSNPDRYRAGFPWHPHRGIETITYVLNGDVEHGDSMGNKGVISAGDTQWMTAGSGIIHQEMPRGNYEGRMEGFQLWANLPRSHKMAVKNSNKGGGYGQDRSFD